MTRPTPSAPQPPHPGAAEAEPPRWVTAAEWVARWRARQEGA